MNPDLPDDIFIYGDSIIVNATTAEEAQAKALVFLMQHLTGQEEPMSSTLSKPQAIAKLRDRGVAKAVVTFSGGNDEGFCDSITLYCSQGEKLDTMSEYGEYDNEKHEYIETEDTLIATVLCEPVYAKYHTFAGEFYVSGEVVWNIEADTFVMDDQYQADRYDEYTDEPADY